MKNILLLLVGLLSLTSFLLNDSVLKYNNNELSEAQKRNYRNITKMYCDSLAEWGQNPDFDFDNIIKFFEQSDVRIYNDLINKKESIFLQDYLLSIDAEHNNSIQFTYSENFNKLDVHMYSPPSLNGVTRDFVELDVKKNIKSPKLNKSVKNFFYIRMESNKIMGIESGTEQTPLRVFAIATKYYEEKNYEKAIKYYEMGKGEYLGESLYYIASMYIRGELPKNIKMKKKKRIAKGIEYLKQSKIYGYKDAVQALDRLGIYNY